MLCWVHFRRAGDVSAQLVAAIAKVAHRKAIKDHLLSLESFLEEGFFFFFLALAALLNPFISPHPATPRELFHVLNETESIDLEKAMKQFKCKNSVPKAFNRLRQARRCRFVWRKILFPLELIFDSCNNIMMKSTRNMSKSHCKGKIKFIIYGYYYLPGSGLACVSSTHSPLSIRQFKAHWTSANIRIQIIWPEKSILLRPQVTKLGLET